MKLSASALCILAVTLGCSQKPPQNQAVSTSPAQPVPSYFHVDPATAGSISGTVSWKGRRPAMALVDMSEDPQCTKLNPGKIYDNSLLVDRKGGVANAFIYIKSGLEGKTFAPPTEHATIDQRGCRFNPLVMGVRTNQEVDIINSDPVTHNIHAMSQMSREWNHSQGPGDPVMNRRFTAQEIMVPVKCNIHRWMREFIGVVDHPYFVVSDQDGHFEIPNLPPGTYTVAIWQEKAGLQEQQVVVPAQGAEKINFELHSK